MMQCKSCGRSFKSKQALGGHMATAHRKDGRAGAAEVEVKPQVEAGSQATSAPGKTTDDAPTQAAQKGEEQSSGQASGAGAPARLPVPVVLQATPSEAEQIRMYWKQGFSFEQLTAKLGFKDATVRQELAKMVKPEEAADRAAEDSSGDGIPVTRKAGSGMEVLNPEAVLRRYTDGSTEDEIELRGMMKLRAAMLMVMDLVNIQKEAAEADARRIDPILKLMQEARTEQDAAAARARQSNTEIAETAAMGAAGAVLGRIDARFEELKQKKADIATVQNPMQGLMARTMETLMNQLTGKLLGQSAAVPGMVDERGKAGSAGTTSPGGVPGMVDQRGGK